MHRGCRLASITQSGITTGKRAFMANRSPKQRHCICNNSIKISSCFGLGAVSVSSWVQSTALLGTRGQKET